MARIEILKSLVLEIKRKFNSKEANNVIDLMQSLESHPKKGKALGTVGGMVIKEIRYRSFRLYFIADGYKLKFFSENELTDLLLRFVRMSDKKHQQDTINEIKSILLQMGPKGLNN